MPVFLPFRGVRYAPARERNLTAVVAPPYDILSKEDVERLYRRSEHNIIRIDLGIAGAPGGEGWHEEAGRRFAAWRETGVLQTDERPAFYVLRQAYSLAGGERKELVGIVGACRLTPWEEGEVLPHEHTFAKPKEDRLKLMRCTGANLSQVYAFYSDPEKTVERLVQPELERAPDAFAVDDDGGLHELWVLDDPERQAGITRALAARPAFIADGHHRYETALAYRDERRGAQGDDPDAGWNFVMMFLVNVESGGVTILPTHRLITSAPVPSAEVVAEALAPWYAVTELRLDASEGIARAGREVTESSGRIAIYLGDRWLWLDPKDRDRIAGAIDGNLSPEVRRLTVTALHHIVLPRAFGIDRESVSAGGAVEYLRDAKAGTDRVDSGSARALVYLPAPGPKDVLEVAKARDVMPHKSTYFYPKLLTGLVMKDLSLRVGPPGAGGRE